MPAGVDYYTFAWEKVGQTDKNYQVLLRRNAENNYDCEIEINGTRYVVGGANSVPGYCDGYSYSIDRWKSEGNIVVTLESDGVSLENVGVEAGQFKQELPPDFSPEGTLLCISAIVKSASGDARLLLSQANSPWGHTIDFIPLQTGFFSGSGNLMGGNHKFSIYLGAGAKIKLAAVKLELGSTQTLAHKEGDKWVLNEIPDHESQLLSCCMSKADSDDSYANNKTIPAMFGAAVGYKVLSDDDDLNTLYVSGMYRVSGATKNCPVAYGQVLVVSGGGDTVAQLCFPWDINQKVMFRGGNPISGGGWTDWTEVITGRTIASQAVNSAKYAGTREWHSYNLKDEKLTWSEETPTEQGTICWLYQ